MTGQLRTENAAGGDEGARPAEFILVCALAFAASVSATAFFCRSMCCEMEMPGGWTMSTMWMRMHGQTWFTSAASFLLMWLAMMVAMMMPSALPMFLKIKRAPVSLSVMATGYFAVWVAAGVGIYALGVAFAAAAMRWEIFSRAVPVLSGAALMAAGVFQFTRWKMTGLTRCRSPFGCVSVCPERETNFRLGRKQGAACCLCCGAPMLIQLLLGMMNPLAMIGVALVIASEKILPRPELTARLVGMAAIVIGVVTVAQRLSVP
jgi:predicted metal-binding membrane protein